MRTSTTDRSPPAVIWMSGLGAASCTILRSKARGTQPVLDL